MLEYRVQRLDTGLEVLLRGSLADEEWTDRLLTFLEENLLGEDQPVVRLNLAEVDYVDLEGVATLIRLATVVRDRGKRLLVAGAIGAVQEKLERTGVLDYLSERADGVPPA
ncbi:MAG: STAS domain-containing protein [Actinobacteria bacterium]|nr:STAS domain-containing protein [Actinomycetota bacterium]